VATDIASRGIDVDAITHVINYDVPHTPEDYVHRIGRTGRVDATGDAFTLMSPEEKKEVVAIERFLGNTILRVMMPDFDYDTRKPDLGIVGPKGYGPDGTAGSGGAAAPAAGAGRRPRKARPFERRPRRR
jgi:ATP-dependent RNA helicase RhlE